MEKNSLVLAFLTTDVFQFYRISLTFQSLDYFYVKYMVHNVIIHFKSSFSITQIVDDFNLRNVKK